MAAWLRSQPFAHGDIKPDNIMVRPDGTLTLVDYDSKDPEVQALIKRSVCLSEEAGTQPKVRYICSNMDFKSVKLK